MTRIGKNNAKKLKDEPTDLGIRKVSSQNFSRIVTLPKRFVNSPFGEITTVKMTMLEDGSLKLTPLHQNDEPDTFSVM